MDQTKQRALSETCRLIAVLFYDPQEFLTGEQGLDFPGFAEVAGITDPLLGEMCHTLQQAAATEEINELRVDYAALFVGPAELLACPYGSVYLENGRRLYGETTGAVAKIYAEAGLQVEGDGGVVPDHIAVELEFLSYLLNHGDGSESGGLIKPYAVFLQHYFLPFASRLAADIIASAKTDFYRSQGKMLQRLCAVLATAMPVSPVSATC
jgi:putative dimethyl sulfoxide reductase chaperone